MENKQNNTDLTYEQLLKKNENLEELLYLFTMHFYNVFELDWNYTKPYIENEPIETLIDEKLNNSNWGNRDELIKIYNKIIALKERKDIMKRLSKKGVVEENLFVQFINKHSFK